MKVYESTDFRIEGGSAVTLGNFDGIHLGHQALIKTVLDYSSKYALKSVMFSFYPHPVAFFDKSRGFQTLLSPKEKMYAAEKMGVDVLVQYPFTADFASLTPDAFFELLVDKTQCKVLVVGENYCFGKGRTGNLQKLTELGEKYGVKVIGIPSVHFDGERVSSTRIRGLIAQGKMEEVVRLLSKPYLVIGKVEHGDKRGRAMDFPTVNQNPPAEKMLPPDGVYFSQVIYEGIRYNGITNVGTNPTFGENRRRVETHILGFNEEIYGKEVVVGLFKKLREEVRFENPNKLKEQLEKDKKTALDYAEIIEKSDYDF
jgi:riboflavin kinase/FMN adenylyltransferase